MKIYIAKTIMHIAHKTFLIMFSPVILPWLLALWVEETLEKGDKIEI